MCRTEWGKNGAGWLIQKKDNIYLEQGDDKGVKAKLNKFRKYFEDRFNKNWCLTEWGDKGERDASRINWAQISAWATIT